MNIYLGKYLMKIAEILMGLFVESGVPRIWDWMKKSPFMIISGWRDTFSREQNRERNRQLIQQLRNVGLAATEQKGLWNGGHESSLFVPLKQPTSVIRDVTVFFDLAKRLMTEYDQDSIIVNDGADTYMVWNEEHGRAPDYAGRMGSDIRVIGSRQVFNAPAWSQKGNYRYAVVDKNKEPTDGNLAKPIVPR